MTPSLASVRPILPSEPAPHAAPVRVLHFHSSKGLYGPERWTHLVLRSVPPARVAFEVLTIGAKPGYNDFARFLGDAGFVAHHLAIGGKIGPEAVRAVRKTVVDRRIDVLHTHGFKSDILGYLATRGLGVGLVTTPHGWCDQESLRIRVYELIGRRFLRGFDRIYPLSDHQIEVLARQHLGSRVRRIRNAVDVAALADVYNQRRAAPPHAATVLFIGRLGREKGLLDLVRALGVVMRDGDAHAVVVGEGPERGDAEALARQLGIAERVRFAGFQPDVRPFLREASVIVLPSYSEGIPRVLMEAFAAGVPVVGTDIPGIRELVSPNESGVLVPTADPLALAAAIASVLRDPDATRRRAARARLVIERDYSPERLAGELCEEYEAIARARR